MYIYIYTYIYIHKHIYFVYVCIYVCITYIIYVYIENEEERRNCRNKENEYTKKRVNTFFNERFKLFQIINCYLSFRRFCCEISHMYACDYAVYIQNGKLKFKMYIFS